MWIYEQATGKLKDASGAVVAIGYSGRYPDGKNNPQAQDLEDVGPIPRGHYRIGAPVDTVTHGAYVLPLGPAVGNQMFGRVGFLIHGDSVFAPGTASEGCVILSRDIRKRLWASGDHDLEVVSGVMTAPDVDGEVAT